MNIVVIGGTGLIGSKLLDKLRDQGHRAVPASPDTGVDTITGEGLAGVLRGAEVVVDVSNSPSFEAGPVLDFFETSSRNLLAAEAAAGVAHHVALSVVGTDRLSESGYFRAKLVQESLVEHSPIPFTILRATQFYEFLKSIADATTREGAVYLPPVRIQSMAADDVAAALGEIAVAPPVSGVVEVAGPEVFRLDELVRIRLELLHDTRQVVADPSARYFGASLAESTLLPGESATIAGTRFEEWSGASLQTPV